MQKDVSGKPRVSLVPWEAVKAISRAREYGVNKYGEDNYSEVQVRDVLEASIRHIYKFLYEDLVDDESGLSHLDHAITSLAIAIDNINNTNKSNKGWRDVHGK